jgi:branched-chain amino acid transport system substrate-binding protein
LSDIKQSVELLMLNVRKLLAAIAAAVCFLTASALVRAQPEPYEFYSVLPLTGGSSYTNLRIRDSMLVLPDIVNKGGGINGRPIHFNFYDDAGNPQTSVSLVAQILPKHPPIIMGSTLVATCHATAPMVAQGPVQWCFSPGVAVVKGGYQFGSLVSTEENLASTVHYLALRGWKRIALLVTTDATGQNGEDSVNDALARPENRGVSVVAVEKFGATDLTVEAQLSRIKAAHPDALIGWTTGAPLETVLRGASEVGLNVPIITTPGNMNFVQMHEMASIMPSAGLFFPATLVQAHHSLRPGPILDAQNRYFAAFKAAHVVPEPGSSYAWDPCLMVFDGLRHLGLNASAQQLHDYLEQLHGFAGINGIYDFRDGGQHGLTANYGVVARWFPDKNDWIAVSRAGGVPL